MDIDNIIFGHQLIILALLLFITTYTWTTYECFSDLRAGQASFFIDANYTGKNKILNIGKYKYAALTKLGLFNKVSSVSLGFNTKVTIFVDDNFSGHSVVLKESSKYLGNFNDKMKSVIIDFLVPKGKVSFFLDANYKGKNSILGVGRYKKVDVIKYGLNDKISSIMIGPDTKVTIFVGDNFTGHYLILKNSVFSLKNFNDKVSSIIVEYS